MYSTLGLLCQNMYSHLVYCAKTCTPIWSTVPKHVLPFCLQYQNVYSHLVYCAKTCTPIWSAVPKRVLPFCLQYQNVYSHLVYCAKTSTPIGLVVKVFYGLSTHHLQLIIFMVQKHNSCTCIIKLKVLQAEGKI